MNHGPETAVHRSTEVAQTPLLTPVEPSPVRENIMRLALAGSLALGGTLATHEADTSASPSQTSLDQRKAVCIYEEPVGVELFTNVNLSEAIRQAVSLRSLSPIGEIFRHESAPETALIERPC